MKALGRISYKTRDAIKALIGAFNRVRPPPAVFFVAFPYDGDRGESKGDQSSL
jgi:hypothetical protein